MRYNVNKQSIDVEVEKINGTCYLQMTHRETTGMRMAQGQDAYHAGLSFSIKHRLRRSPSFEAILHFDDFMIHLKKDKDYFMNGKKFGLNMIADILARLAYAYSSGITDLWLLYLKYTNIPENIRYALENRVPYHFYEEWNKCDVRLNVMQIDSKKYAIEISDSVWGEISSSDLNTFINSYRFDKKRGNWHSLSPKKLFARLIGRVPTSAEETLMIAFLKQNRTRDIVEQRAKELVSEMCEKYPDRIFYKGFEVGDINYTTGEKYTKHNNEFLFVKGKLFDWKIQKRDAVSGEHDRQNVSVYVYNVRKYSEEDEKVPEEFGWLGPICIDNMTSHGGNSIGDQMVARALALMNDNIITKFVGTIQSYIREEMSERRLSFDNLEELI